MCSDCTQAQRVSDLCPKCQRENGARRSGADPAELAASELQPVGVWHFPVSQVRAAVVLRGYGWRGAWPGTGFRQRDGTAGGKTGPLPERPPDVRQRSRAHGDRWRSPSCMSLGHRRVLRASSAHLLPTGFAGIRVGPPHCSPYAWRRAPS
jgi:hypothetical protein